MKSIVVLTSALGCVIESAPNRNEVIIGLVRVRWNRHRSIRLWAWSGYFMMGSPPGRKIKSKVQWGIYVKMTPHEPRVVSNRRSFGCLFNSLYRPTPINIKGRVIGPLWEEFTGDRWIFPYQGPVTRKKLPFDDVTISPGGHDTDVALSSFKNGPACNKESNGLKTSSTISNIVCCVQSKIACAWYGFVRLPLQSCHIVFFHGPVRIVCDRTSTTIMKRP